ncbi:MAG: hypothetical protein GOMPHAMPRED_002361 [Gomphillus americanus]|uniref:Glycosyltransferase n=1 Tax=Gomphillus americanus TaxID=1940652 RepID=A0A8H3FIP9_9LECA|nr:MAG: hypothetical protein GOMPHAMPRED_002361 [Gomphillus americanus]
MRRWTVATTLLLIFLGFYQYARMYSYRDPGSLFFDASRAYETKYSDHRLEEIRNIELTNEGTSKDASVCAVISTYKRPVETTVQSALAGLYLAERRDLHLALLFAHADPTVHPSWGIDVESISYKSSALKDFDKLAEYEAKGDTSHKGVEDYALALEYCLNTTLPWAAIFEDDILFADSWFARLKHAISQEDTDLASLLYFRMFNDERATGWSGRGLFANHELYIGIGIDVFVLLILLRMDRSWSTILPALVFVPFVVLLFFASGKATMLPPRPGVRKEEFGCCSQALVYPRHQLRPLMEYLRKVESGQVDLHINDYGRMNGFHRKSIYPVMVQHRGATIGSVRGTTVQDARQIWSMAFEELEPAQLQHEHHKMAKQIWPDTEITDLG